MFLKQLHRNNMLRLRVMHNSPTNKIINYLNKIIIYLNSSQFNNSSPNIKFQVQVQLQSHNINSINHNSHNNMESVEATVCQRLLIRQMHKQFKKYP